MKKLLIKVLFSFVLIIITFNSFGIDKNNFTGTIENWKTVKIFDDAGNLYFECSWKDAKSKYKNADTIYELGWNSHFTDYWFWSNTPMYVSYFAKVHIQNKHLDYFDPPKMYCGEYCFNADKGVLIYSNYIKPHDKGDLEEIQSEEFQLICYYIFDKKEVIIDKQIGKPFRPKFKDDENRVYYNKGEKELSFVF